MAKTPSRMVALGTSAPDFALPDFEGKLHRLSDFKSKAPILVMFICNHCPYVKHIRDKLSALGNEYQEKGVGVFAINSNDALEYPDDSAAMMKVEAKDAGYRFPYLVDESQTVARAYDAACTPDFFLFDKAGLLVYRGQFDESRPGNNLPVTGWDLRQALDAVLKGRKPAADQTPSLGCNIKWKRND